MRITTIDLDLAMNVFQVHGVGATGQVVVRKSLRAQMLTLSSCLLAWSASRRAARRITTNSPAVTFLSRILGAACALELNTRRNSRPRGSRTASH
jgi:hypothetical protein